MRLILALVLSMTGCGDNPSPSEPDPIPQCLKGCTCNPDGTILECPDVRPPMPASKGKAPRSWGSWYVGTITGAMPATGLETPYKPAGFP